MDLRPLERINGCMVAVVVPFALGGPGLAFGILALMLADEPWGGLCVLAATPVIAVPGTLALLALFRWSRTGKAGPFLRDVADDVGGDVTLAGWTSSVSSPSVEGEVDGHPFRVTLRRRGGVLSPATVGSSFLTLGWMYDLVVRGDVPGKLGYMGGGHSGLVGLFGLKGPVDRDGVTVYTGGTPDGEARATRAAALDAARPLATFGPRGSSLVRVSGGAVRMAGVLHEGVAPAELSALIRHSVALLDALSD